MRWCDWSNRVLPGYEWDSFVPRFKCENCGKRVRLVAGRLPKHTVPAR